MITAQFLLLLIALPVATTAFAVLPFAHSHSASVSSHSLPWGRPATSGDHQEDEDGTPENDDECDALMSRSQDLIARVLTGPADAPWALPNSFEMFLTQCSLQSLLFLIKSMRDPHTVLWLEQFAAPTIELATTAANSKNSNSTEQGASEQTKLLSFHGLAAMNTTKFPEWDVFFGQLLEEPVQQYIVESDLSYVPDYELDINPASLCTRLLSVREQIAREFVQDLQVLSQRDGHVVEEWHNNITHDVMNATYSTADASSSPSPLRKGNFDLLLLLATQESIHRMLNTPDTDECSDRDFLQDFYLQRLESHFGSSNRYGRARDFCYELYRSRAELLHELVQQREQVALEWKVQAAMVPDSHIEIQRLQFEKLMASYGQVDSKTEQEKAPDTSMKEAEQEVKEVVFARAPLSSSSSSSRRGNMTAVIDTELDFQ